MGLMINLRDLETQNLQLRGQLPAGELDIETMDAAVQLKQPLEYALEVQQLETSLLLRGSLEVRLDCQCVRCLKEFAYPLRLDDWTCHIELQGEEAVPVNNDCVDLTPLIREDILLELPQHPLCQLDCRGLPVLYTGRPKNASPANEPETGSGAWAELNKLKLKQ